MTATATHTPVPRIETIGIARAGTFYLRLHNSAGTADIAAPFIAGVAIVGDWTGSGIDRIGAVDTTTERFTVCVSADNTTCAQTANQIGFIYGQPNDIPSSWHVGTGLSDGVSVNRPSTGITYFRKALSTGFADDTMIFGAPGDKPTVGDWSGKGFDSPGLYRNATAQFFLSNQVAANGTIPVNYVIAFGATSVNYTPIAGSWLSTLSHDGVGLFANTTGSFYLKNDPTISGFADNSFIFGLPGDQPVAGHWQSSYPPAAFAPVLVVKTASPLSTPLPANNISVQGDSRIGG